MRSPILHSVAWPDPPNSSATPPLSDSFSLLPEIRDAAYALTPRARIELQMRRWRREPIFGVVENKLLAHTLLASLQAPQARILYVPP